jgi:uncharacterized protein (TIGR03435 family)
VFVAIAWPLVIGLLQAGEQQTPAPQPAFEVASVKLSTAGRMGQSPNSRSWGDVTGRISLPNIQLQSILTRAYDVKPYQISGPSWLTSEFYDIVANVPKGAAKEQIPLMFQALLADRFRLTLHRETQMTPVYALVVAKGGPKLQEVPPESDEAIAPGQGGIVRKGAIGNGPTFSTVSKGGAFGAFKLTSEGGVQYFEFLKMTMKGLAAFLSQGMVGLPVVDMTDLKGFYHVPLETNWAGLRVANAALTNTADTSQSPATASDPMGLSIVESLQRIGLRLEHQKAPIEKLIIDHIEKVPAGN